MNGKKTKLLCTKTQKKLGLKNLTIGGLYFCGKKVVLEYINGEGGTPYLFEKYSFESNARLIKLNYCL